MVEVTGAEQGEPPRRRGRRRPPAGLHAIESCNSTWLFDTKAMRFRRVPKGTPLDIPAAADDWAPYFKLEIDTESDAFMVTLNESGTRLLRSFQHSEPCSHCEPEGSTAELSLEAIRRTAEGG